jgi:hypothetical protein
MLKPLVREKRADTPQVIFSPETEEFLIKGRSLPENAEEFYMPLLNWMEEYISMLPEQLHLVIELEYFNSSSVKQVLNLLILLENLIVEGKKVLIIWSYDEEDELMEMKGRELQSILNLPFKLEAFRL